MAPTVALRQKFFCRRVSASKATPEAALRYQAPVVGGSSTSGPQLEQRTPPSGCHVAIAAASSITTPADADAGPGTHFDKSDWDSFLKGYKSQYMERSYWIEDSMVEGAIPAELEGTLLRNGPGLFEVGGQKIPQPFDGDGMLAMFAFKGGRAFFANRYVRTKGEWGNAKRCALS
jgi:hypothetical protein